MFTGIIEQTGIVKDISIKGDTRQLSVYLSKKADSLKIGDSISVSGVCLSVVTFEKNNLIFDVTEETFKNTSLRRAKTNDIVNIERSLKREGGLDGHFVLGHVDGTRKIKALKKDSRPYTDILIFPDDKPYVVKKGSIAIDGISLTVSEVYESAIRVFLIPHTLENTNLKHKKAGDEVNIEFDILGKYAQKRLLCEKNGSSRLTEEFLKNHGFI